MRVGVRVDAGGLIGGGHAMRCLTLANELARDGAEIVFATCAMPDAFAKRIQACGHELTHLPAIGLPNRTGPDWHDPPLGDEAQIAGARATGAVLGSVDWLVVDHYLLDAHWHSAARRYARHILVVDDLANRSYDCNLLVDETGDRTTEAYRGLVPGSATVLAGAHYALLRPEFARERVASLARRGEVQSVPRILVSLGTTDPEGVTATALEALLSIAGDCPIDVVLGSGAETLNQVERIAACHGQVVVHVDIDRMAELMRDADLAIGAAGTTSWERCCLGLPSVALVLAENQRGNAEALARSGAAIVIDSVDAIGSAVATVLGDEQRRRRMSAAAFGLTDGEGTGRVVRAMLDSGAERSAVQA